jgi:hypothetical protein
MRNWTLPNLDLWAAFPSGRRASTKARVFAAFVEDQLRLCNLAAGVGPHDVKQPSRTAAST